MSLVVAVHTGPHVFHIADCRLSGSGFHVDDGLKTICLECLDATCFISYVGVADLGGTRTNKWLTNLADVRKLYALDLISALNIIGFEAEQALINMHSRDKRLTFLCSGIKNGVRFNCLVSNFESHSEKYPTANSRFGIHLREFGLELPKPLGVKFVGDTSGITPQTRRQIRAIYRSGFFHEATDRQIAAAIGKIIRRCSTPGGTISECSTAAICDLEKKQILTVFQDTANREIRIFPDLISPRLIMRSIVHQKDGRSHEFGFQFKSPDGSMALEDVKSLVFAWFGIDPSSE
jgi:hypothetical protein